MAADSEIPTTASIPTGEEEAGDAEASATGPFGGMSASEAARRRWERVRAGEIPARKPAGSPERDKPPEGDIDAAIISALEAKAVKGDHLAARELREWRRAEAQKHAHDEAVFRVPLSVLTAERRAVLTGWLEEGAATE